MRLQIIHFRGISTKIAEESSDVFGTLSRTGSKHLAAHSKERYLPDDPDQYDKEEFDLAPRKNAYYYRWELSKNARKGPLGLRKALEQFHTMKSKDRLTPTMDNFSPLIYGCAKAGYTKRAFEIYDEASRYLDKPTASIITCLINACAESPFQEYGLKRLDWFREHLKLTFNYTLNRIQYNCAIKAYGKLGQLETASQIVQEMIQEGFLPDTETFNMLLIGCASHHQAGTTIALRLFKRMRLYGLKPDHHTYRLLLRCIRDCGMGPPELIKQTFGELPAMATFEQRLLYKKLNNKNTSKTDRAEFEWLPIIDDFGSTIAAAVHVTPDHDRSSEVKLLEQPDKTTVNNQYQMKLTSSNLPVTRPNSEIELPNLLSDNHINLLYRIQAIHFDKLLTRFERFMLFGGMHGFLEVMLKDGCKPDNKIFTLMLKCIRSNKILQAEYFRLAKDNSIRCDSVFYDQFIRHVCRTHDDPNRLKRALAVLDEMHKDSVRPSIATFEGMAFGCEDIKQAKQLVHDMKNSGLVISDLIIDRFFQVALHDYNFSYLNNLISLAREHKFKPKRGLIDMIEEKKLEAQDALVKYEKGLLDVVPHWLNDSQIKSYDKFRFTLSNWLKTVELDEEDHPWAQYQVESTSKRQGLHKFVQEFKALDRAKLEALKTGEKFGNLSAKIAKIRIQDSQSNIRPKSS